MAIALIGPVGSAVAARPAPTFEVAGDLAAAAGQPLDVGKTYTLSVAGVDPEGVARIQVELAGNGVQEVDSTPCSSKRCGFAWPLVPSSFPPGTYTVTVGVTNVFGRRAQGTLPVIVPEGAGGDVVHAQVRYRDGSSKQSLFLEEWAKLGTWTSRAVSDVGVETQDAVPCPAAGRCAEYRFRSAASGDLTDRDGFLGVRGASLDDDRVPPAGWLRAYVSDLVSRRPVRRGPIGDVLFGGQRLPPDAGSEYELYQRRDVIDNGESGSGRRAAQAPGRHAVLVRTIVDARTKLPLRETTTAIADGSLAERLVWSYTPQRLVTAQLGVGFFTLEEPARPSRLASMELNAAPPSVAKDHGGRSYAPVWLGGRKTFGAATYCAVWSGQVRAIARPWPGQKPQLADGPIGVTTRRSQSMYRRVSAGGRCPGAGEVDLTIASTARASVLARTWRRSVARRGGRRLAGRRGGFRAGGLVVKTGKRSAALYVERGATAILVHGHFAVRDVPSLLSALRPRR